MYICGVYALCGRMHDARMPRGDGASHTYKGTRGASRGGAVAPGTGQAPGHLSPSGIALIALFPFIAARRDWAGRGGALRRVLDSGGLLVSFQTCIATRRGGRDQTPFHAKRAKYCAWARLGRTRQYRIFDGGKVRDCAH